MVTEVSAVQFRQNPGEMLRAVQSPNTSILVEENGKPVAALIDAHLFERIRRSNDRLDELREKVAKSFADIPEEEGLALIDEAVALARKG